MNDFDEMWSGLISTVNGTVEIQSQSKVLETSLKKKYLLILPFLATDNVSCKQ